MDIKQKFLDLTTRTYPHGTESELLPLLNKNLIQDEFGNYFLQIGENPNSMFTSHLDTASWDVKQINHIIHENIIGTDGKTILGADDKAGVTILLYMIEKNVPGLYYFFLGEERGCIGSKKLSDLHSTTPLENINKVVSFDRRGYDSVITHQMSGRCCSDEFASELSKELNKISSDMFSTGFKYSPDPTGIYTDSAQFTYIYKECTNISVGYHNEHSCSETQNIEFLEKLCNVVCQINWEDLSIHRDITSKNDDYNYYDDYEYYGSNYRIKSYKSTVSDFFDELPTKTVTIFDTEFFGYETVVEYDTSNYDIISVKQNTQRSWREKYRIESLLKSMDIDFYDTEWDGNTLTVKSQSDKDITLTRQDITEFLPKLNDWIEVEIRYSNIS